MFHHILVAVDRSPTSRKGFEVARSLARATGARLTLLHVLSPDDEESPHLPVLWGKDFYPKSSDQSVTQIYEDLWKAYEARGIALLQPLVDDAKASGIQTERVQKVGSAGSVICDVARQSGIDLIILGRRGGAGVNEWLLGSVSTYVLHHAPCSVLVIHPHSAVAAAIPPEDVAIARS